MLQVSNNAISCYDVAFTNIMHVPHVEKWLIHDAHVHRRSNLVGKIKSKD